MKTKLLLSTILLTTLCAFIFNMEETKKQFNSTSVQTTSTFNDSFYVGVLDFGDGANHNTNQYHDVLSLNLWHEYPRSNDLLLEGWTNRAPHDSLFTNINSYRNDIQNVYSNNYSDGMKTLMHRIKIDYLAMGQRSDYQCETEDFIQDHDYWFYTYHNVPDSVSRNYIDDSRYGNNAKVRYCRTPSSSNPGNWENRAGYVVSNLKANREQINYFAFSSAFMSDQLFPWYIKPRIRIDSIEAANNPEKLVCRIDVYNFNGFVEGYPDSNRIKTVDIKTKDFKDSLTNNYDGKYREQFKKDLIVRPIPVDTNILARNINPFNPDKKDVLDESCKVDFRVYWYGQCDMWIDYVRVDNKLANDLFNGSRDEWFQWEVDLANYNNSPLKFYVEEFEFNNIPCMKYVAKKLREISGGKFNLMCDLNYGEFSLQMPNFKQHLPDWHYIKKNLIDSMGSDEFCTFAYPFNAYDNDTAIHCAGSNFETLVYVSNTLPISSYSHSQGRLSLPASSSFYDQWLAK